MHLPFSRPYGKLSRDLHTPSTAISATHHEPKAMVLPHCAAKSLLVLVVRPLATWWLPSTPAKAGAIDIHPMREGITLSSRTLDVLKLAVGLGEQIQYIKSVNRCLRLASLKLFTT